MSDADLIQGGEREKDERTEVDLTTSFLAANVYGTLLGLLPGLALFFLYLGVRGGPSFTVSFTGFSFLLVLVVLIVGIVIHELLHAMGWMVFAGAPRSTIEIGVKWRLLTPYAHGRQPMPVTGYRWGTFLPGLVMGLLPSLLAIAVGSFPLIALGVFFTVAAGGDFLVLWLLRSVPVGALVEDHPSRVGCIVYL